MKIARIMISGLFDGIRALEKENDALYQALKNNQITDREADEEIQKRLDIINGSWKLIKEYSQCL